MDEEAGSEAVSILQQEKLKAEFILCDVGEEHGIVALIDKVKAKYKQLDVLINNAGIADPFM